MQVPTLIHPLATSETRRPAPTNPYYRSQSLGAAPAPLSLPPQAPAPGTTAEPAPGSPKSPLSPTALKRAGRRRFTTSSGARCALAKSRRCVPCGRSGVQAVPPPPPAPLCRPKFQPPQSEGAGRGLVPRGDQETGEQTFCCPHPPQQKWGRTESRPSTPPPPPRMPSHPHCRPSHGDPGPSGSGRRATSMLGSGTRMVTQQVVLLSHASEQVDPSTTLPPPPPPACAPDGRGARSRRPQGLKSGGCEGLTA